MIFSFFSDRKGSSEPSLAPLRGPAELRAYWEALRNDGAIPSRAAIDPRGISDLLHSVFLGESIGRGMLLLRIAGSGISAIAGTEARGLPLSVLFGPRSRPLLGRTVERVLAEPLVAEFSLHTPGRRGQPPERAQMVMLPLVGGDGRRNLVLACLATAGSSATPSLTAAQRLEIIGLSEEKLTLPEAELSPSELAAAAAPALPQASPPRHPHLRLVYSAG